MIPASLLMLTAKATIILVEAEAIGNIPERRKPLLRIERTSAPNNPANGDSAKAKPSGNDEYNCGPDAQQR